ncbi:hypothetical protein ACFQ14_11850 [Pseudahrensia aquimaris]|uniref:Uncharacterized protein n=1 Tax=Pseudahrensia aquimaris TaxID=744461 RepID=A0ABW3FI04_9HYPH
MTINVPKVAFDRQQVNASPGATSNSQQITELSDGTFVIVCRIAGKVLF